MKDLISSSSACIKFDDEGGDCFGYNAPFIKREITLCNGKKCEATLGLGRLAVEIVS